MKNLKKCVSLLLACLLTGASAAALSGCDVQDILNGLQGTMSSSDVVDASGSGGTSDGSSDSGELSVEDLTPSVGLSYKLMSEMADCSGSYEDYYVVMGMGTCTDTCVVIPSEYNGLPVKEVHTLCDDYYVECLKMEGASAGMFEEAIDEVIDEYLEEMGMTLTSVAIEKLVIPDSVMAIYFICLDDLKELYIGKGVSDINKLFIKNLQTLVVDEENENYSEVGGNLHSKDGKTLLVSFNGQIADGTEVIESYAFTMSNIETITIPDSVTSIADYMFCIGESGGGTIGGESFHKYFGCSSLTSVVIGNGVTSIGRSAFAWCSSLTSVVIPDSVTSIGDWAFEDCSSLTSVVIPDSVTSIGGYAFEDCSSLMSIEVSENNTTYKSIDGNLYSKDGKTLIQYAIGKTATSFTIPDSVTSIGYGAFEDCSSLMSIEVSENNTTYKSIDGNLYSKDGATLMQYAIGKTAASFTIPDSVTGIGRRAFWRCSSLTSVVIGNSVTSIGDGAFLGCSSLASVVIGDSVTSIGNSVFAGCSCLTSITCNGTKAQWYAITKGGSWEYDSAIKTVVCTDGTVSV